MFTVIPLTVFDKTGVVIGYITDYYDESFFETLDCESTYEFKVPFDSMLWANLVYGNKIGFQKKNKWKIFDIVVLDDDKDENGQITRYVKCEGIHYELYHVIVNDYYTGTNITNIMNKALTGSGWTASLEGSYTPPASLDLDDDAVKKNAFTYMSCMQAVQQMADKWQVDVEFTYDVINNHITNKVMKIYQKRGITRTTPFTVDANIIKIRRIEDRSNLITRMYGLGSVLGTYNTGMKKYLTFKKVIWEKSKGKPLDKPVNQIFIDDPEAQAKYGVITGVFQENVKHSSILINDTYMALQATNKPSIKYEINIVDLEALIGDPSYTAELGDTVNIYDAQLSLDITARITEISGPINGIGKTTIKLDNYINNWKPGRKIDKMLLDIADSSNPLFVEQLNQITIDEDTEIVPVLQMPGGVGFSQGTIISGEQDREHIEIADGEIVTYNPDGTPGLTISANEGAIKFPNETNLAPCTIGTRVGIAIL